ncbi:MAG TPA: DUF3429 family protein [Devosia sp.]|nr:DUF3429 family protein [Devosia sp.]
MAPSPEIPSPDAQGLDVKGLDVKGLDVNGPHAQGPDVKGLDAPSSAFRLQALILTFPLAVLFILALAPFLSPLAPGDVHHVAVGYATILLGFHAGVRAGARLRLPTRSWKWQMALLSGPGLGLLVLLLETSAALAVLIVGFGALGAWDSWAAFRGELPRNYGRARMGATILSCLLLILIFVLHGLGSPLSGIPANVG